jgi:hypothetical protein
LQIVLFDDTLTIISCSGIDLGFKYSHRRKSNGFKSGEHGRQETGVSNLQQIQVQNNFWAAIAALHD